MPIYQQKSIILFNQLVMISMIITIYVINIMVNVLHMRYMPRMSVLMFVVLLTSQYLAYRKKIITAIILVSSLLPFILLWTSIYSKMHGESNTLFLYFTPRVFMGMYSMQSVAFIGFHNLKKCILGLIPGVLMFAFYDLIHNYYGVGLDAMYYDPIHQRSAVMATAISLIYTAILIIILQKINQAYEKVVIRQKEDLIEKNAEIEQQKDEIEAQHNSVVKQRDEIATQKKMITDSINYALNIQKAIFPTKDQVNGLLNEHFIFFKPRNTVSGDFYFVKEINADSFVVAVADCTGHGVPGAFMSILGINFLTDIVSRKLELQQAIFANEILNELKDKITISLHQTGEFGELQDGMDIALCVIDRRAMKMQFAGANSPAYIIRQTDHIQFIEIKPDQMPIGIYKNKRIAFTNNEINLSENDALYLFSDGYKDQFGGNDGRKFLSRNFKDLLGSISMKPMHVQVQILIDTHNEWIGKDHEQLDDILVMGLRIKKSD